MMTRNFAMAFAARKAFGFGDRKKFREEWSKMTNEEKVECMNKRFEAMNNDENGFFGNKGFGVAIKNRMSEKWAKMSDEERKAFIKEREKAMNEAFDENGNFNEQDLIASIDARCEEWMKKTPEEKAEFIKTRQEAFCNHGFSRENFFGKGRGFGFDFCEKEDAEKETK